MKVLITGAAGKLATEVAEAYAPTHDLVYTARRVVDTLPDGAWYPMDLAATDGLDERLETMMKTEHPDVVIHLASMLGSICEQNPELAYRVNVDATKKLAELAIKHGVRSFIFASTGAVYTQTTLAPVTESQAAETPRSVYGQTKLRAEQVLADVASTGGTDFTALRMFNVYGRRFTDSVVTKLIHSTEENPVGLIGPDTFYRDYVHVSDVIDAFSEVIAADYDGGSFQVLNIASGVVTSNSQLLEQLKSQGVRPHYTVKGCLLNVAWANIDAARTELGFNPKTAIVVEQ